MVFLSANNQVELRHCLKKFLTAGLGHATHEAIDHVFSVTTLMDQIAHFTQCLLFCLVANRARVDEHGIGLIFIRRDRVAALTEHFYDLFGVALVHLAAVGFDVEFRHGVFGSSAQARGDTLKVQDRKRFTVIRSAVRSDIANRQLNIFPTW